MTAPGQSRSSTIWPPRLGCAAVALVAAAALGPMSIGIAGAALAGGPAPAPASVGVSRALPATPPAAAAAAVVYLRAAPPHDPDLTLVGSPPALAAEPGDAQPAVRTVGIGRSLHSESSTGEEALPSSAAPLPGTGAAGPASTMATLLAAALLLGMAVRGRRRRPG